MHAFEAETRFAERANMIVQKTDNTLEELRREYRHIAQQYSVLLNEVMKITRVSDATQTELRRTRKELFVALQQAELQRTVAERLNEQKTEILSIAAHDLKNPLAGIMGLVELLKERFKSDLDTHDILSVIYDSSDKMLNLIQNILSNSALEFGKIVPEFIDCSVLTILSEVILANTNRSQQKNQTITFTNDASLDYSVHGDMQLLYELCDNLISNAIKYSPNGRVIDIELSCQSAVDELSHQPVTNVCLSVKDEGPGLSEEDKAKLFGYFQRLSAKPTAGESSHGIGLAVAKRIVELHKGNIWAESNKDGGIPGATFFVTLPHRNQF